MPMARRAVLPLLLLALCAVLNAPAAHAQGGQSHGLLFEEEIWTLRLDTEEDSNPNVIKEGDWRVSGIDPTYGDNCLYTSDGTVKFLVEVPKPDYYELFLSYCEHPTRAMARVTIFNDYLPGLESERQTVIDIDMTKAAVHPNGYRLGKFYLAEERATIFVERNSTTGSHISVDHLTIRQGVLLDTEVPDGNTLLEGEWKTSSSFPTYTGKSYFFRDRDLTTSGNNATFFLPVERADVYSIYLTGIGDSGRPTTVPVAVFHRDGVYRTNWNQLESGNDLFFVGAFPFEVDGNPRVVVSDDGFSPTNTYITIDALWMTRHSTVDDSDDRCELEGPWTFSNARTVRHSFGYHFKLGPTPSAVAQYHFDIVQDGIYDLEIMFNADATRAEKVEIEVVNNREYVMITMAQNVDTPAFRKLDAFAFRRGTVTVSISNNNIGGNEYVIADAFRLTPRPALSLDTDSPGVEVRPESGWGTSSGVEGFFGNNYRFSGSNSQDVRYSAPKFYGIAEFDVYAVYTEHPNRAKNALYKLRSLFRPLVQTRMDQTANGGKWRLIGRQIYGYNQGTAEVSGAASGTIADGIKFVFRGFVPGEVVDTEEAHKVDIEGSWVTSSSVSGFFGEHYLHNDVSGLGAKSVTYHLYAEVSGNYSVLMYVPADDNRASNVPVTVTDTQGNSATIIVDQRTVEPFARVGKVYVAAGNVTIKIGTAGTDNYVIADAVGLTLEEEECGPGLERDTDSDSLLQRCRRLPPCSPGTYRQTPDVCAPCAAGTYSNVLDAEECRAFDDCAPGTGMVFAGNATTNRVCEACVAGSTFSAGGTAECAPCRASCDTGEYIRSPCTTARQTECELSDPCADHEYASFVADGVSPTVCTNCTVCQPGQYVTLSCSETADAECGSCNPALGFSSEPNQPSCTGLTPCFSGSFEAQAATASSDRECVPCAAGTTDNDRDITTKCQPCGPGRYVPRLSIDSCDSGVFNCSVGKADLDRNSSTPCVACLSVDGYSALPGATVCTPMTKCKAGERSVGTPTGVSDRNCVACPSEEYQNLAEQTSCKPASVCDSGFEETAALTRTSDRECTACAAGKFKAVTGSAVACEPWTSCSQLQFADNEPSTVVDRVCRSLSYITLYFEAYDAAPTAALTPAELRAGVAAAVAANVSAVGSASDVESVLFNETLVDSSWNVTLAVTITFRNPAHLQGLKDVLDKYKTLPNVVIAGASYSLVRTRPERPAASAGSSSSSSTALAAGVGGGVALLVLVLVAAVLLRRKKKQGRSAADRETVAFENPNVMTNPMYDAGEGDDGLYTDLQGGGGDQHGLYDEPPMMGGDGSGSAAYFDPSPNSASAAGEEADAYLEAEPAEQLGFPAEADEPSDLGYLDVDHNTS